MGSHDNTGSAEPAPVIVSSTLDDHDSIKDLSTHLDNLDVNGSGDHDQQPLTSTTNTSTPIVPGPTSPPVPMVNFSPSMSSPPMTVSPFPMPPPPQFYSQDTRDFTILFANYRPCVSWRVVKDKVLSIYPHVTVSHVRIVSPTCSVVRVKGYNDALSTISCINTYDSMDRMDAALITQGPLPPSIPPHGAVPPPPPPPPPPPALAPQEQQQQSQPETPQQSEATPISNVPSNRNGSPAPTNEDSTAAAVAPPPSLPPGPPPPPPPGVIPPHPGSFVPMPPPPPPQHHLQFPPPAHPPSIPHQFEYWTQDGSKHVIPASLTYFPVPDYTGYNYTTIPIPVISQENAPKGTFYTRRLHTSTDKQKLFIGNIPYATQWQDLKDFLRAGANIFHVELPLAQTGRSMGYAIATFYTEEDAAKAINIFNGAEFNGRELSVNYTNFHHKNNGTNNNGNPNGNTQQNNSDDQGGHHHSNNTNNNGSVIKNS